MLLRTCALLINVYSEQLGHVSVYLITCMPIHRWWYWRWDKMFQFFLPHTVLCLLGVKVLVRVKTAQKANRIRTEQENPSGLKFVFFSTSTLITTVNFCPFHLLNMSEMSNQMAFLSIAPSDWVSFVVAGYTWGTVPAFPFLLWMTTFLQKSSQ